MLRAAPHPHLWRAIVASAKGLAPNRDIGPAPSALDELSVSLLPPQQSCDHAEAPNTESQTMQAKQTQHRPSQRNQTRSSLARKRRAQMPGPIRLETHSRKSQFKPRLVGLAFGFVLGCAAFAYGTDRSPVSVAHHSQATISECSGQSHATGEHTGH